MSSLVGPSPPLIMIKSDDFVEYSNSLTISSKSSSTETCLVTSIPISVNFSEMYFELVFVIDPIKISFPTVKMLAFIFLLKCFLNQELFYF